MMFLGMWTSSVEPSENRHLSDIQTLRLSSSGPKGSLEGTHPVLTYVDTRPRVEAKSCHLEKLMIIAVV